MVIKNEKYRFGLVQYGAMVHLDGKILTKIKIAA